MKGSKSDATFLLILLTGLLGFNAFLGREWWQTPAPEDRSAYHMGSVPQTLVVSADAPR